MKKISRLAAPLVLFASFGVPFFAAAQINVPYLQSYSDAVISVINFVLVPALMAIAFIVFLYGVYKYYIKGAANDTERATGHQFVLWGIIGFVVILSLWGIVNIVRGTLGLTTGNNPTPPTFKTTPGTPVIDGLNNNPNSYRNGGSEP